MKDDVLKNYLYISWDKNKTINSRDKRLFNSYMSVVRASIYEEISVCLENIGDFGVVFSSYLNFDEVKKRIKHQKNPYILIDLSLSLSLDAIDGYLNHSEIDVLKMFIKKNTENTISDLQEKLNKALEIDDFESAIIYRDLLKNKK